MMLTLLLVKKLSGLAQYSSLFYSWMIQRLRASIRAGGLQKGQGLVEYAMILILVAVVVIIILALLGPEINRIYGTITCALNSPTDMIDCFETPEPPAP